MKKTILLSLFLFSIIGQLGSSSCIPNNLITIHRQPQTRLMFSADGTRVSMISTAKIRKVTQTEQRDLKRPSVEIPQLPTAEIPQPPTAEIPQLPSVEIPQLQKDTSLLLQNELDLQSELDVILSVNVGALMSQIVRINVSGLEGASDILMNTLDLLAKSVNHRCDNTKKND